MPKEYRDIVNKLVDQGWEYRYGKGGGKPKLIPPDPNARIQTAPLTPSDQKGMHVFVQHLKAAGAVLDDPQPTPRRSPKTVVLAPDAADMTLAQPSRPRLRNGQNGWDYQPPVPAPAVPVRVTPPPNPDDARGTVWSLPQARDMLRQGYHVRKVISKTGWGMNHLKDLIDHTGYIRL